MSHEHHPNYPAPLIPAHHTMGRDAQVHVIRQALERIDGAPTPQVGMMQAAMGNEAQIRLIHDVIREHLDARGLRDTAEWARELEGSVAVGEVSAVGGASALGGAA